MATKTMNIHKHICVIAALGALCTGVLASGKDETSIRQAYHKLASAMKSKDVSAIKALEGPGYTETERGKVYSAAEANSMMTQEFQQVQSIGAVDINVLSLKVSGS